VAEDQTGQRDALGGLACVQMRGRRIVVAADHYQETCSAVLPNGGNLLGDPCALTGVGNAPQPGPLGLGGGTHAVQDGPRNRAGADDRRLPSHGQRGPEERPLPRSRVGGGPATQHREHPRPRSIGKQHRHRAVPICRDREAHVQQRHPRRDPDRLQTHASWR